MYSVSGWFSKIPNFADHVINVSTREIIRELPKLSEADRRAVRDALLAIANENPHVALCNKTAQEGAMMFNRMEDEFPAHHAVRPPTQNMNAK